VANGEPLVIVITLKALPSLLKEQDVMKKIFFILICLALTLASAAWSPAPLVKAAPLGSGPYSIGGVVWQDFCAHDCAAGSSLRADNGVPDIAERRLYGMRIGLNRGRCSAKPAQFTRSDLSGSYTFSGLIAGTYCLTLNAKQSNRAFPKPGLWTSPVYHLSRVVIRYSITVGPTRPHPRVNFGWFRH
jgi:hypothetical protein